MEILAHIQFADGQPRPVIEVDGRQYVLDDEGDRVYGVWFIPRDEEPVPIMVDAREF
jgi:hypothetical protein